MPGPRFRLREKLADDVDEFIEEHEEIMMDRKQFIHHAVRSYMRSYELEKLELD